MKWKNESIEANTPSVMRSSPQQSAADWHGGLLSGGHHELDQIPNHILPLLYERLHHSQLPPVRVAQGNSMKRLHLQYAAYRRNGFNRRDAARLALRDVGIKTFRLAKTGHYHHSIHNWNWRT